MRTHSTYWAPGAGPGPAGTKQISHPPFEARSPGRLREGPSSAGSVRVRAEPRALTRLTKGEAGAVVVREGSSRVEGHPGQGRMRTRPPEGEGTGTLGSGRSLCKGPEVGGSPEPRG